MNKHVQILASVFLTTFLLTTSSCEQSEKLYGCKCEDIRTIERTVTLGPDKPTATIGVYSEHGDFLADASCHADFNLRFYWKSAERAKTNERPPISYTMYAGIGYIPNPGSESTGKFNSGDNWWRMEEGAAEHPDKHEATNYAIEVNYGSAVPDGEVTCEIILKYKVYAKAAYEFGCED
jgi:hypothetical protein